MAKLEELSFVELTEEDLQQILIKNHHKTESEVSSFLEEAQTTRTYGFNQKPANTGNAGYDGSG